MFRQNLFGSLLAVYLLFVIPSFQSLLLSQAASPTKPGSVILESEKSSLMVRYDRTLQRLVQIRNLQLVKVKTQSEFLTKLELSDSQINELVALAPVSSKLIQSVTTAYNGQWPEDSKQCEWIEQLSQPVFEQLAEILTDSQYQKFLLLCQQESLNNLTRRQGLSTGTVLTHMLDLPSEFADTYNRDANDLWQLVLKKRSELTSEAEAKLFDAVPEENHEQVRAMMQTTSYFFLHNRTSHAANAEQFRLMQTEKGIEPASESELKLIRHAAKINATISLLEQLKNDRSAKSFSLNEEQKTQIQQLPSIDVSLWSETGYGMKQTPDANPNPMQTHQLDLVRLANSQSTRRLDDEATEIEEKIKEILTAESYLRAFRKLYAYQFNLIRNSYCPTLDADSTIALVCSWEAKQKVTFTQACDRAYREITTGTERTIDEVFQPFAEKHLPADKRKSFLELINGDTWRLSIQ